LIFFIKILIGFLKKMVFYTGIKLKLRVTQLHPFVFLAMREKESHPVFGWWFALSRQI